MKIGFTGTQHGMSKLQKTLLRLLIRSDAVDEFHHGDCIGADAESHTIALLVGERSIIHPPSDCKKRAYCKGYKALRPTKPYLQRNKDIVNATDLLIAAPHTNKEELRSGTWSTVRYARSINKPVLILPR